MSPGELPLESAARPAAPEKYEHKLAVYAVKYGTHLRNLKNWIAVGKEHQDKPPLDRPDLMPEWWSRRMKHRVPEKIISMAREFSSESGSSCNVATAKTIRAPAQSIEDAIASEQNTGSSLDRLREAEGAASKAYLAAVGAKEAGTGDEGDVEIKQRRWERAADMLRKSETAYFKMADIKGDNLARRDVARHLQEIHSTLESSIRGLLDRVLPKIEGKPAAEQRAIWHTEIDRAFLALPHELAL